LFLGYKKDDVLLYHQITTTKPVMKKLITNTNPFILLLLPVLFAMAIGVSYQVKQKTAQFENAAYAPRKQATSLFNKGVVLFKTVVALKKEIVW
jgi:hypothetical protein